MPDEPPDDDDPGFVDDDGISRCGVPKKTGDGGPCEHPVPGGTCPAHGGVDERRQSIERGEASVVDGVGSGDPGHAMGDGGGAPVGNKNAMSHGVHAVRDDPRGTLRWIEENDPQGYDWILAKWESYMADAPFSKTSAKADDVMEVCLMRYAVRGVRQEQVERGLTKMVRATDESGTPLDINIEDELPGNLPANRIAREARSMLKDLGILDDPETQKAEAMSSWGAAAQRVAERRDDDTDGELDT